MQEQSAPDINIRAVKRDAIVAALIHLAQNLQDGVVSRDDGDIGAILTCDGTHAGLSVSELRCLAQHVLEGGLLP